MRRFIMPRFEFPGLFGRKAACGLERIDLHCGRVVVIATELPDKPGVSVTNFAEELATMVCDLFGIDPARLVWIEHYPPRPHLKVRSEANWDLVTFKADGSRLGVLLKHPKWRRMKPIDWQELGLKQPV